MSEKGYEQAVQNYVYEIDRITEELDSLPGSVAAKTISFLARGEAFEPFKEKFIQLDIIALQIQETYGKTHDEFDQDVIKCMGKTISKYIEENLLQ